MLKAPWQWIASPLGYNILLSILKENTPDVDKYKKVNRLLQNKEECTVTSNIYISSSHDAKENIKKIMDITVYRDVKQVDFTECGNKFADWVNKYDGFGNQVEKQLKESETELVFANISLLESNWEPCKHSGRVMKIYNSFNYTQDIKYEARLLEFPLRSDFKLVVIIPHEEDVLHKFFGTLVNQGMTAAVNSIQPIFTVNSELKAPCIEVSSSIRINEKINTLPNGSAIQYGSIAVNEKGTLVKVLTCIYYPLSSSPTIVGYPTEPSFYFAVVFNDTPIFTGQFTPPRSDN